MSMAHSIETRVPLLDHKLVEFAATIPPEMNLRGGTTKYVLKRAMRGIPARPDYRPAEEGFRRPLGVLVPRQARPLCPRLAAGRKLRSTRTLQ